MADNPPGVYHKDGTIIKYKPTHYEKYAQKRLEQALLKLWNKVRLISNEYLQTHFVLSKLKCAYIMNTIA